MPPRSRRAIKEEGDAEPERQADNLESDATESSATDASKGSAPISGSSLTTRGGVTKKIFQPKVPTRRAKKSNQSPSEGRGRGRGRGRSGRSGNSPGRGRGKGRTGYYQSQDGVFAQGFGPAPAAKGSKAGSSGGSKRDGQTKSSTSTFGTSQASGKADVSESVSSASKPEAAPVFQFKHEHNFVESESDDEEGTTMHFEGIPDKAQPVRLPLHMDLRDANVQPENYRNKTPGETFPSGAIEGHELIFFQLPAVLPFSKPPMVDVKNEDAPTDITGLENAFAGLGDTKIGKLQIRRSGKMELVCGDHRMAVNRGTAMGFSQQFVAVDPTTNVDGVETGTGKMIEIGVLPSEQRYIAVPFAAD